MICIAVSFHGKLLSVQLMWNYNHTDDGIKFRNLIEGGSQISKWICLS